MALSVLHALNVTIPDAPVGPDLPDDGVRPSDWNAEHTMTVSAASILGATGAGPVAQLTAAQGRSVLSVYSAAEIDASFQPLDADLTTWAGLSPSANFQTLVPQTFAQMRASLDLEAGTDFYSITAADAAFQPKDANLTAIAALSTQTFGRSVLTWTNAAAGRTALALPNSTTAGRLGRYTDTAGALGQTTGLFEDSSGSVGIGTTSTTYTFNVYTNSPAPSSVKPNIYSLHEGKGDNATFIGVSGGYFQARDRSDVNSGNKGVLYGIHVDVAPQVARGNSPYDDVVGVAISNAGSAKATEAIYVGTNAAIVGSEFGSCITFDCDADYVLRATGAYTNGIDFVTGATATFSGAAILLPNAAKISARNAANNANLEVLKLDSSNSLQIGAGATTVDISATAPVFRMLAATGTNRSLIQFNNTGGSAYLGLESSSGGTSFFGTAAYAAIFGTDGAKAVQFATNNTVRATIDSSGNVGISNAAPVNKLDVTGSFGLGAPVTKTTDFTLAATENWVINNRAATNTATLPAASSWTGRIVMMSTIQAQTVVSASSNVVPLAGGAAGTAILAGTAGKWALLVSDGTNWVIMMGN